MRRCSSAGSLTLGLTAFVALIGALHFALPSHAPPGASSAVERPSGEDGSDGAPSPGDALEELGKIREAREFFLLKRSPDGREIPYQLYENAKQHARRMPTHAPQDRSFGPSQDAIDAGATGLTAAPAGSASPGIQATPLTSLTPWTSIGPANIGGRVGALVIDPTAPLVMYAGGDSGGLFKSTDGGANWAPLGGLFPGIGVNALAMSPVNHNVLYAGTGWSPTVQFGAGIFVTADGGANWTWLTSTQTADFNMVNDIVVNAAGTHIFAATNTGVFGSANGGTSWVKVFNAGGSGGCMDLTLRNDLAADSLVVSCGGIYLTGGAHPTDGSVWRNPDVAGSGVWSEVLVESGMGRVSLAVAPSQQATIYALASSTTPDPTDDVLHALYRSLDGGATWTARVRNNDPLLRNQALLSYTTQFICNGVQSGQGFYDNVVAVDPTDPNRVWVGGIDSLRSDDGGANWGVASIWWAKQLADAAHVAVPPQYSHADFHTIAFAPGYNGTTNQTMYVGNDGGVFRTDNARAATQLINNNDCAPNNNLGGITGSVAWTELNHNFIVTEFYDGVAYPDGATYFGGAQDNGTVRGTDAGGVNAWTVLRGGDGGFVAVDPTNTNILYQENDAFSFRKSVDGGATFNPSVNGVTGDTGFLFITPFQMDPSNAQTLWAGGTYIWRTTDGAANWVQASAAVGGHVQAVAISPTNPNHVLVAVSGGNVLRSNGALATTSATVWTSSHPGPAGGAFGLTFDPTDDNVAYVLFSRFGVGHVWKTTDGGATWFNIDGIGITGLPDIPVHTLVVDPLDHNRLYIGTDLGVFATLDGGANWAFENTGFANVIAESLKLNTSGGQDRLYAFTYGRSAWRASMPAACVNDTDCDGVLDVSDNCPTSGNSGQLNTDAANTGLNRPGADAVGDACDDDKDGDGYPDSAEIALGKNPLAYCQIMRADVDGDGVVSILDLAKVAQYFTQTVPPAPERYKQDADNKISILDLTRMAQVFTQHVTACP